MKETGTQYVNPPGLPQVPGYSHVVEITKPHKTVYISGQVPFDAQGNMVGEGDLKKQCEQVFHNIDTALKSVGGVFSHVVKLTFFMKNISQIAVVREVRDNYINTRQPPASSAVEISRLIKDDILIEIEAIAAIPIDE